MKLFDHSERIDVSDLAARTLDCAADSKWVCKGTFPDESRLKLDRISAMGAAILAFGERISSELKGGNLRYSLIAGEIIRLGESCFLIMAAFEEHAAPLLEKLGTHF